MNRLDPDVSDLLIPQNQDVFAEVRGTAVRRMRVRQLGGGCHIFNKIQWRMGERVGG